MRRVAAQLPYIPRAAGLVWAAAKPWTIGWIVLLVVQGLLPVATVHLTKLLVDSLVEVVQEGGDYRPTLIVAALMAGVLMLAEVLRGANGWVRTAQSELVQDHIQSLIHDKSTTVDLAFYDWPEFYDHLHRARQDASYRPIAMIESLGGLLQNGITLVAMAAVLLRFGIWVPAALIVSTLPAFFVVLRHAVRQHEWRRRRTADERLAWYQDWLLTSRETAAELRLFGLGEHFRSAYQALRRLLRTEQVQLAKQQGLGELGAGVLGLIVMGGATIWMVWQAIRGRLTLGDLALFYQAFHLGLRLMRSLLESASQLYANILFLGNLFEFLALEPLVVDPAHPKPAPSPLREGIRFHKVSFRYPGSERDVLRDFSLIVPAGQLAAIVGPNGTGKSTLLRLLCRFYDPDGGRIELDGADLRDLRLNELRRLISAMFQEPVHYNATAEENIALGDWRADRDGKVAAAAAAAGADQIIRRLPRGYENLLGKWFVDGAELSVGEWQRVALARTYYREAPIIVLDEPTSAMDPWAEMEWMGRFRLLAAGRTALVMTHRLTTAMLADVIHVMRDGRIVESGSHDELLAGGGTYAQAWAFRENT